MNAKNYCCGFAFSKCRERVALIQKLKPEYQKGKLNGIGGKIEPTDSTPVDAMVREFREETGLLTSRDTWESVCVLKCGHKEVGEAYITFFRTFLNPEEFSAIRTVEQEEVVKPRVSDLHCYNRMSNLDLLIALALDETVIKPFALFDKSCELPH